MNFFHSFFKTCPWWVCPTFDNPLRRLVHDPERLLGPLLTSGQTIVDIGAGQGYFTIPIARMTGDKGRVFAVDIQEAMLQRLMARAARSGVDKHIVPLTSLAGIGPGSVDLALAFWMVHEVDDQAKLLNDIAHALRPGGLLLIAEPLVHASAANFAQVLHHAAAAGFHVEYRPSIFFSRAVLLKKTA